MHREEIGIFRTEKLDWLQFSLCPIFSTFNVVHVSKDFNGVAHHLAKLSFNSNYTADWNVKILSLVATPLNHVKGEHLYNINAIHSFGSIGDRYDWLTSYPCHSLYLVIKPNGPDLRLRIPKESQAQFSILRPLITGETS